MHNILLDHVIVGTGAQFDARHAAISARLTLHPLGGAPWPANDTLRTLLLAAWPPESGPLSLNITNEAWLAGMLSCLAATEPVPHWQIEVPAFLLNQPGQAELLAQLASRGQPLVLTGRLLAALAPDQRASFVHAIVDTSDDVCSHPALPADLPFMLSGARTLADVDAGFRRGAIAVLGWPLGDPPDEGARRKGLPAGVRVVLDLMQRLDREEPAAKLEGVLRGDPMLAFRLMRYINSPGFGLPVEISSFQHAIMLLGYKRLKRWLAMLMVSAVDNPDMMPLLVLAVRRGLLMEALASPPGDEALRSEAFICGVFSLLDRMLGQSFEHLLDNLPVPERVARALAENSGPHAGGLALAVAVESGMPFDILEAAEALMLAPGEVNRAVLKSLAAAQQLQLG
jgi:c-di-GMP phosphodiesterase